MVNDRSLKSDCFVIHLVPICCVLALSCVTDLRSQETETSDQEESMQVDVITYRFRGDASSNN